VAAAPTDGPVLGTRILQSEACADAQYVIAALLPPRDAAALSGVNKDYYFIARSPLIWASHVQHIRKTNPEVQAPLEVYDDPYEEYKGLRAAGERHSAEELVSHVKSFKGKELLLLRTFGTVTEPGAESATFEPNGPISLPVPAQLALELLFALDNVPSSKAAPVTGDVYAKVPLPPSTLHRSSRHPGPSPISLSRGSLLLPPQVASILGVNKTSLRRLREDTVGNTRRPLDLARRLAAPFGAPAGEGGRKRGRPSRAAAPALDGATVGPAPDPERRPAPVALPPVALPRGGAERLQQRNVALEARMNAEAEAHAATATSLRVEQRARAQLMAEVQRLRERLQDAAHASDQQRLAANARIDTLNGTILRMQAQAERLRLAAASFATCMADFARHEPLCEHLIEGFPHKVERFAVAYARGFPSREPTPKAHVLLYHMAAQMGLLGGVGLLHEGIVEAAHVRDNEYRRRFVSVIDPCENLRLRFNAYQLHARRTLQSVREPVWDRDMRKRARRSALSRARKSGAFEECEECEES